MMTSWLAYSPANLFSVGEPGVWFDPSDVANLNWRRNLLTWTEQFDNAAWVKADATFASGELTESATTATHGIYQGLPLISGQSYRLTFRVQYNNRRYCRIGFWDSGGTSGAGFDLVDKTVTGTGNSGVGWSASSASISEVSSGVFDLSVTVVSAATGNKFPALLMHNAPYVSGVLTAPTYLGNVAQKIGVVRGQIELGSTATDYQRITDLNTEVIERFPTATLYQDTAGTTPVTTTGQSVGLLLDKSKGLALGSERITNGDFSSGSAGWVVANADATHIATFSGGTLRYQSDTTSPQLVVEQLGALVVGRTYLVEVTTSSWTSGSVKSDSFGGNTILGTGVGTVQVRVVASSPAFQIVRNSANVDITIDNISVKELPGNHAVQATTANRPIYGIHPVGGRRNLLVRTEEFDSVSWTKVNLTATANAGTAPDGTVTADRLVETTATNAFHQTLQPSSGATATTHTVSAYAKAAERNGVTLLMDDGAGVNFAFAQFNLSSGAAGTIQYAGTGYSGGITSIQDVGNGWYRCSVTASRASAYTARGYVEINDGATRQYTGNTSSGILIWGAQLETGSTATAYQRVADQYNVTEAGVPSVSYLFFDGVNDSLDTPSINFATATSDGQARRNLLTFPTAFDDAAWTKTRSSISANAAAAPDGTITADKLAETVDTGTHNVANAAVVYAAGTYTVSSYVKAVERSWVFLVGLSNNDFNCFFNLSGSGSVGTTASGTTGSISDVGDGWFRVSVTKTFAASTVSGSTTILTSTGDGVSSYAGTAGSGILIWGAQLETGTTASAFQNIGTDKMTVFAGVRKLSDAAAGMIAETSVDAASNNGAFRLLAPGSAGYEYRQRGTLNAAGAAVTTGFAAPVTSILTGIGDIANDVTTLRVNGTQAATSSADQGTGTYGNYPLFIGARAGTSLFFSGHLYSLIVRGAQSNTEQISSTETWVAGKTGVVI
jgi:hypothetical protein